MWQSRSSQCMSSAKRNHATLGTWNKEFPNAKKKSITTIVKSLKRSLENAYVWVQCRTQTFGSGELPSHCIKVRKAMKKGTTRLSREGPLKYKFPDGDGHKVKHSHENVLWMGAHNTQTFYIGRLPNACINSPHPPDPSRHRKNCSQ